MKEKKKMSLLLKLVIAIVLGIVVGFVTPGMGAFGEVIIRIGATYNSIFGNFLKDVSPVCMDYMKTVPTTWDETCFIDGYPGKYVVLARRHGGTWYVAAINAGKETLKLKLDLEMFAGKTVSLYKDDKKGAPQLVPLKVKENGKVQLEILPQGGAVLVNK